MSTKRNDNPLLPPPTVTASAVEQPMPDLDARTHALRALAQWFCALRYTRTMAPAQPPQPFALTPDRVFIEQPDNVEKLEFPAIGIIPGRGQYLIRGLGGADIDEDSYGIAGPGTVLVTPYDYQELLTVEGWGSKIAERRSLIAAIEVAIASYEGTTDLRLILRDYFDVVATFSIVERENIDDLEVPRGRRRVHIFLQMTVPVIAIERATTLKGPFTQLNLMGTASLGIGGANAQAQARAKLEASSRLGGLAGLAVFGLNADQARAVARATLGVTQAEALAMTDDYLLALVQSLAAEAASLETWWGRPPYSPGSNPALDLRRRLQEPGGP